MCWALDLDIYFIYFLTTYGTHNVPGSVLSALQTLIHVTCEAGTCVSPLVKEKKLRHQVDWEQQRKHGLCSSSMPCCFGAFPQLPSLCSGIRVFYRWLYLNSHPWGKTVCVCLWECRSPCMHLRVGVVGQAMCKNLVNRSLEESQFA